MTARSADCLILEIDFMADSSRKQHMDWCKKRALEYVEICDIYNAWNSMVSDLGKHPETANHIAIALGNELLISNNLNTPEKMKTYIEGFN